MVGPSNVTDRDRHFAMSPQMAVVEYELRDVFLVIKGEPVDFADPMVVATYHVTGSVDCDLVLGNVLDRGGDVSGPRWVLAAVAGHESSCSSPRHRPDVRVVRPNSHRGHLRSPIVIKQIGPIDLRELSDLEQRSVVDLALGEIESKRLVTRRDARDRYEMRCSVMTVRSHDQVGDLPVTAGCGPSQQAHNSLPAARRKTMAPTKRAELLNRRFGDERVNTMMGQQRPNALRLLPEPAQAAKHVRDRRCIAALVLGFAEALHQKLTHVKGGR